MALKGGAEASGKARRGCASALLCASAASAALFVYTAVTFAKYTPLYEALECRELESGLGPLRMDASWINITGIMRKSCQNPNSYAVRVEQRHEGRVFVRQDDSTLMPVGLSTVPESTFPAHGEAEGESRMSISVPASEATALLAQPLLRVVTEISIRNTARLDFLGFGMRSSEDKDEVCGFEVRLSTQKVGPSACAASLKDLVIPGVDTEPQVTLVQMQPEHLTAAALQKNAFFAVLMSVSGLLFLTMLVLGLRRLVCGSPPAREAGLQDLAEDTV